jgi:AAA domain
VPSLAQHQSNDYTKLLIMGDPSTGKTGALASLVADGYKLRILDYDNGLDVLKQFVLRDSPDLIDNVEFRPLQEEWKAGPEGHVIAGSPKAFVTGVRMLSHWKYDDVDLGIPAHWGPDTILVLDSLTRFSDAAFAFRESIAPPKQDRRALYGDAQNAVEATLATLCGANFCSNVIVISHIRYQERQDGMLKGYPLSVGAALSPKIPAYFNSVALCQTVNGRRMIQTAPTNMIDLKNPAPFTMAPSYTIGTGLAEFFRVLRQPSKIKEENQLQISTPHKPIPQPATSSKTQSRRA